MSELKIERLFANDIHRRIEEVIKVDQSDEQIIFDEIGEYVVTDAIRRHLHEIINAYWDAKNKPHEGVGIWVSGFFGSGKSSFAKMLGLALENRTIQGQGAAELIARRTGDKRIEVLLKNIEEHIPSDAVVFDVSTDRGIRSGSQKITEIMYRQLLQRLGYAKDLDLAELEITLEGDGRLGAFTEHFKKTYGRDWDYRKNQFAMALQEASRVMHDLDPHTFTTPNSWVVATKDRSDISPGLLAERCLLLLERRRPGRNLVFVIDEVGQFVSRDVQKILDLQAVVQNLGRVGRGKLWLIVTSQEKLGELVGGLDGTQVELSRLMDRFPLQVHLEPSDISEVTSKRVLSKNADAEATLRKLFSDNKGRLTDTTRLSADVRLPELSTEQFIDLYPLLPYQVGLVIDVVSGLRMQGGANKHVGGANRTIIKLAQQLLIHESVNLAGAPVGRLARIDQMYDLVAGNISSELRGKIDDIGHKTDHPMAKSVAKAICLLQYVKSIHRTAENLAATLHPAVDTGSQLPEVKRALEALERAHMVRRGDDGYRIPSPAEDDWEQQRTAIQPKTGDIFQLYQETIDGLWKPQPGHTLHGAKVFKAGLFINSRLVTEGDIPFHLTLVQNAADYETEGEALRARSRAETKQVFWAVALDDAIDREAAEVVRSREILARKERNARTKDETALVQEETVRRRRHENELRRLMKTALLTGQVFFRGNDRSPDDRAEEVPRAASRILEQVLPDVYNRFEEAAAQVKSTDLDALMKQESLRGLPPVFAELKLLRDRNGVPVFETDSGPLAEVLAQIEHWGSYGDAATGSQLTEYFDREPFGWGFDTVRLFTIALLRADKIEAISKGQVIETALSVHANNTFDKNNLYRQASFQLKRGVEFDLLVEAVAASESVFGQRIAEINQGVIVRSLRDAAARHELDLYTIHRGMVEDRLPGADVLAEALGELRSIRTGSEEQAIKVFIATHAGLKEAIKRGAELTKALDDHGLNIIRRARETQRLCWPFLSQEDDLDAALYDHAGQLDDLLRRETFFRELQPIDRHASAISAEFKRRYDAAVALRDAAYTDALQTLRETPGCETLDDTQQHRIAGPLERFTGAPDDQPPIPQLRADIDACPGRLDMAIRELMTLVDGNRIASVSARAYFSGGIETEEQLDAALQGLRDECASLIGAGKKVLVQ